MTSLQLFALGAAAILTGFSKAGFGGGINPLISIALVLLFPAEFVIGVQMPLLLSGDILGLSVHWKKWDLRLTLLLLLGGVFGVLIGNWLLGVINEAQLKQILAILVLIFSGYQLFIRFRSFKRTYAVPDWVATPTGLVMATTSTLAHLGGPPLFAYLLLRGTPVRTFIGTTVLTFFVLNWLKVPGYIRSGILNRDIFDLMLWMIPLVFVGALIGRRLSTYIRQDVFELVILILMTIPAVLLLL